MGPDNAVLAGPWTLLNWPRQTPLAGWAQDIRVQLATLDTTAIELVDGPWSCAKHEFRENGLWLDLTLVHVESGRSVSGTFDMEDGVWAQSDGSGHMTVAEFHRAYASNATAITFWPAEPFKDVHAPSELSTRSPDGQFYIDLTTNQWRMSDWICPPRIVHIPTGDCLLDLKTTNWDGRAEFRADGSAELRLRQYPGVQFTLTIELNLAYERYRVTKGEHDKLPTVGYIDELQRAIGRSAQDLDELGVSIDVRASKRDEPRTDRMTVEDASDTEEWAERRDRLGLNANDDDYEPVELAPLMPTPVAQPIAKPTPVTPTPQSAPVMSMTAPSPMPVIPVTPAPSSPVATVPAVPVPLTPKTFIPSPATSTPIAPTHQAAAAPAIKPAIIPTPVASAPLPAIPVPSASKPAPAPTETPASTFSTPRGAEMFQRPAPPPIAPTPRYEPVTKVEPPAASQPLAPQPIAPPSQAEPARADMISSVNASLDAAASMLGLNGDETPAPPPSLSLRGTIEAIEAEVTRQRLNAALHYEMIVLGVIRAAASGITKPADAVSILQTLAARREDIGPKS